MYLPKEPISDLPFFHMSRHRESQYQASSWIVQLIAVSRLHLSTASVAVVKTVQLHMNGDGGIYLEDTFARMQWKDGTGPNTAG